MATFAFPGLKKIEKSLRQCPKEALKGESMHLSMRRELYSDRMSEMFLIPVKDPQEGVSFVLVIMHDITKLYGAREELKLLNKALAEKTSCCRKSMRS